MIITTGWRNLLMYDQSYMQLRGKRRSAVVVCVEPVGVIL